jgi:ubiquinone/menaquinone biosynthesis C-methylase UbiE
LDARDVKEFFEKVAADWDTMRLAYYDERVIEKMVEALGLKEGMSVADVGTGTGFVAAGLASRVGQVVAVDNSPKMLKVPRKNLGTLGAGNVELVEGDRMDLALDERGVDAAFANIVLHHAGNTGAMLKEMARVVRTGGTVAICDEVELPYECMREEQAEI